MQSPGAPGVKHVLITVLGSNAEVVVKSAEVRVDLLDFNKLDGLMSDEGQERLFERKKAKAKQDNRDYRLRLDRALVKLQALTRFIEMRVGPVVASRDIPELPGIIHDANRVIAECRPRRK